MFTGLPAAGMRVLSAAEFRVGSQAMDTSDRIIYDLSSGDLLYDPDGIGAQAAVQFADVAVGLNITAERLRDHLGAATARSTQAGPAAQAEPGLDFGGLLTFLLDRFLALGTTTTSIIQSSPVPLRSPPLASSEQA